METAARYRAQLSALLASTGCGRSRRSSHAVADVRGLRHSVKLGPPIGGRLSYLRAGPSDARRLILVHGTPGEARQWADYLVKPPRGLEVVAVDRLGFGESGPAGAVTSLQAQAAAVAELLGPRERPSILLGHSLGGPVVAEVAALYPDRIAAVIFLASAADPGLECIHPLQIVGAWSPVGRMLGRKLRNANAELLTLKAELERLSPRLAAIRASVLIVHGTADPLTPFANVAYLERRLTGANRVETVALEGADHFLPWKSAEAVRKAIRRAAEVSC